MIDFQNLQPFEVDLGFINIPITFNKGNETVVDFIYLNPTDDQIGKRLLNVQGEVEKRINKIIEKHKNVELTNEGTAVDPKFNSIVDDIYKEFYKGVDEAFGSPISKVIFKYLRPLAVTNGQYYYKQFFEKFIPYVNPIAEEMQRLAKEDTEAFMNANREMRRAMEKYKK